MKKLLFVATLFFSLLANAQGSSLDNMRTAPGVATVFDKAKDTVKNPSVIHDTVVVYAFQFNDTVKVPSVTYKKGNKLRVAAPGYNVLSGYVIKGKDGKFSWIAQPVITGVLDDKKRRVIPL